MYGTRITRGGVRREARINACFRRSSSRLIVARALGDEPIGQGCGHFDRQSMRENGLARP